MSKKVKNNIEKTVQQLSGLRLQTKAPISFKDRKKDKNKKACRGKVKYDSSEKE